MKKHINFFYSGKNPYGIKRFKEVSEKKSVSYKFIDLDSITVCDNVVKNEIIKEGFLNIGLFIGYSKTSIYLMSLLKNHMTFPQKESWDLADKFNSHAFLLNNAIPTPPTSLIFSHDSLIRSADEVGGFPCIIKKTTGGNGKLVEIIESRDEALNFIMRSRDSVSKKTLFPRDFAFILQKPIKESYGTDYRALCIGTDLVGIMQRTSINDSFKANFSLGGKVQLVQNIPEIESISKKIMQESNLFMAGIDFIKGENGYLVIEINTSPQFKGFEKATNIDVAEIIVTKIIKDY